MAKMRFFLDPEAMDAEIYAAIMAICKAQHRGSPDRELANVEDHLGASTTLVPRRPL